MTTADMIAAVVASAHVVPAPAMDALPAARYVRVTFAGDYSALPLEVRHEIERGVSNKLHLVGWRLCAVDEVDLNGEVWVFTTKATRSDPAVETHSERNDPSPQWGLLTKGNQTSVVPVALDLASVECVTIAAKPGHGMAYPFHSESRD